ncbi:hypothetical protein TVAG_492940 [Trichomonas vaginalis G3]|uniref:Borealin N-terminal domain-containing protein n=1 Tax=Trichomonas vaginalis (strain ATCC PRA-98 / G3) TaxID=412133 RepID=A2FUT7_TRIV3|nr:Nbl1 / Borealin N terminal family [Trichomonas vaginalis G3]EAX91326.1 hypothetical protein TVAG_492940 [Trichomonas vaginalis G3]KAI5547564.1 Nbl1 / Borealin N terminal family [Trichomonas vaginalis G3]|eukprot:XP_001304256.1 hypothetical protein [Trichomonas vaginalis G3]
MDDASIVLQNFDKEVECRCSFIRSHSENLSINMLSALDLALMGIPEPVRKMSVKTLMTQYDGDIIKASNAFEQNENEDKTQLQNQNQKRKGYQARFPRTPTTDLTSPYGHPVKTTKKAQQK